MNEMCKRCKSSEIEYNDNISSNVTTIECRQCGYMQQQEYEEETSEIN